VVVYWRLRTRLIPAGVRDLGLRSAVQRIVVVGCAGSGKTVVSRALGQRLGLPVIHLDALYYNEAWNPRPYGEFCAVQREIVSDPEWMIDGNYVSSMPIRLTAADGVIIMDVPTVVALWGVFRRWWKYRSGQHSEGAFVRITAAFLRYVARFRKSMRPRVVAVVREHAGHAEVRVLRSWASARRLVNEWASASASSMGKGCDRSWCTSSSGYPSTDPSAG
jgi:adenylate kinase family enzyme